MAGVNGLKIVINTAGIGPTFVSVTGSEKPS